MPKSQKEKKEQKDNNKKTIVINDEEKAIEDEVGNEEIEPDVVEEKPLSETEKLQNEVGELNDKLLRLQADFDNYRKRTYKDLMAARTESQIDTLEPMMQVFDHFDMAVTAAEKAENMEAIKEGLKMIFAEFSKALNEMGVERIDAVGQDFNPNLHEAVAKEPSEDIEEGKVIKQWRSGYKMGDRLIRPANVVVSSGPPEE